MSAFPSSRRWIGVALMFGLASCGGEGPGPVAPSPVAATPPADAVVPPDPAPVVDGDITVAYENGVRILVKRIPGAELAAMHLYIRGGVRNWSKKNAGIEELALRTATEGGTAKLDKDAFSKRLSALGSDLGAGSGSDYSIIAAKSLTGEIDATFELMAAAFLTPAMPESEIEIGRQRQLLGIRREKEVPDGRLGLMVHESLFAGHPYEHRSVGTEESVKALTRDDMLAHLAKLRETSRLALVVVGDVEADHVRELVRRSFGQLPRGSFSSEPLPAPSFTQAAARIESSELPTNYIQASFIGPSWKDPDLAAGILAMKILSNRVWEEVRTKRNLSYAPKAGFQWGGEITRGMLYVTAVDPNTTMKVMYDEVARLQHEPVPEADMAGAKAQFLTSHLTGNESTDGQASWLAMTDLVGGDYRLSRELPERIKSVSAGDVQGFAKKWVRHMQTVVVGDPEKIDKKLFESL